MGNKRVIERKIVNPLEVGFECGNAKNVDRDFFTKIRNPTGPCEKFTLHLRNWDNPREDQKLTPTERTKNKNQLPEGITLNIIEIPCTLSHHENIPRAITTAYIIDFSKNANEKNEFETIVFAGELTRYRNNEEYVIENSSFKIMFKETNVRNWDKRPERDPKLTSVRNAIEAVIEIEENVDFRVENEGGSYEFSGPIMILRDIETQIAESKAIMDEHWMVKDNDYIQCNPRD